MILTCVLVGKYETYTWYVCMSYFDFYILSFFRGRYVLRLCRCGGSSSNFALQPLKKDQDYRGLILCITYHNRIVTWIHQWSILVETMSCSNYPSFIQDSATTSWILCSANSDGHLCSFKKKSFLQQQQLTIHGHSLQSAFSPLIIRCKHLDFSLLIPQCISWIFHLIQISNE